MHHITNITNQGRRIKEDERYTVTDVNTLQNLTVSETVLYAGKGTSGHHHDGLEEVYIFTSGNGVMILGEPSELKDSEEDFFKPHELSVAAGDTVCVPSGWFHKVINNGSENLVFTAIFQKYER